MNKTPQYLTLGRRGLKEARTLGLSQAGIAFAACFGYAAISDLPEMLWWSSLFYASAVPLGLCQAMISRDWHTFPLATQGWRRVQIAIGYSTNLLTLLGTIPLLWHISIWHTLVFVVLLAVCVLLWTSQSAYIRRTLKNVPPHMHPSPTSDE
jgi:hypothetical protein